MRATTFHEDKRGLEAILNELTLKEGVVSEYLVTRSREQYDRLLRAALVGRTPENITLGRSGMKLDRRMIIPPDSILCC